MRNEMIAMWVVCCMIEPDEGEGGQALHASLGGPRNRNATGTFDVHASLDAANLKKERH